MLRYLYVNPDVRIDITESGIGETGQCRIIPEDATSQWSLLRNFHLYRPVAPARARISRVDYGGQECVTRESRAGCAANCGSRCYWYFGNG